MELNEMEVNVIKPNYTDEISAIIKSNTAPGIMHEQLEDYHDNDIAEALDMLSSGERKKIYRIFSSAELASILEYTDIDVCCKYLNEINIKKAAGILEKLESDTASEIIQSLDRELKNTLYECMSDEFKTELLLMASFDDSEIGCKMTTNYIVINKNLSIKKAMSSLIRQASENDNISTIFVTNEKGAYYGAIDLKELIIAREETPLEELIMTSYPYVYGHEDIDDCIEQLKDYSEDLIPVLDNNNGIIGVITAQSIIEVVDEELGEDYAMLAGLTAEEDLKEPLSQSMKKRLPWLFVLLGLGILVSSVVGIFEKIVSQLTIIMCFQSLILGMAGNVGTQSLAVTIRVLMDETLTGNQKFKLVLKEMKIGFTNGLLLGLSSFIIIGLYIYYIKGLSLTGSVAVSGCIGISLLISMIISATVGTLIPLLFKKINIDPAVASGPLITTINDLIAVISYYGLSWLLLINILNLTN